MKKIAYLFLVSFALGMNNAFATLKLRVSDGTAPGTVVITDQQAGDFDPATGKILYFGTVGSWRVFVAGLWEGPSSSPYMDIGTSLIAQDNLKPLTIELSETDFTAVGTATSSIGGLTDSSVTYRVWQDLGNNHFVHGNLLTILGPFPPTSFSGTVSAPTGPTVPYAVTLEVTIQNSAADTSTSFDAQFEVQGTPVTSFGGCRVTGGSNHQTNSAQSACVTTPLPSHISHGGQVGASVGVETPFDPNSACISGEWQHNRHLSGKSLVGVLHASGNGNVRQFDSLLCACLPCDEDPNAVGVVGEVCNPGARICGPLPRKAPANKICFSGVGDYTFTNGKKTVKAVFRVDIEDRSEGNSHASDLPLDRYRMRIWLLDPACGRNPDPNSPESMLIRLAASADPTKIATLSTTEDLKINIPPDIDDGGNMTQGNHQIHPQTGAKCRP